LGRIIPTDELIFFRGVETTNQYVFVWWLIWFDLIWFDLIDGWMDGWMHRCLHNILLCVYIYYIDLCAYEVCTCNDSIGFSFALMCLSDQCAIDSSLAE
jgi:hypothetical protein